MGKNRTCFASSVCCSDDFTSLSFDAQALYYRMSFESDLMGAVDNAKSIMRVVGVDDSALAELISANYVIEYKDDCEHFYLIKHYWVSNKLDRYNFAQSQPSRYQDTLYTKFAFASEESRVYVMRDETEQASQSEISLKSVLNIIKKKQINKKEKKKNLIAGSFQPSGTPVKCPNCGTETLAVNEGGYLHGECPIHGNFFIDPATGGLISLQ